MAIKIENVPITKRRNFDSEWEEFLLALRDLKIQQSFVVETMPSHFRLAVSIAQVLLGRTYVTSKDKKGRRVGRIK